MKDFIKEFIYVENPRLSSDENLKIQNRSNHDNIIHQALFKSIDEFSKRVIKDLHNSFSDKLFDTNKLNLLSDESTIEKLIINSLRNQGQYVTELKNPEMIYRSFNFLKPSNLLPDFNDKLYLIKQLGITEKGVEKTFVLNPYFFGFKISFDIFINCLFCSDSQFDKELENGLIKILTDKYGEEYKNIYDYVSYVANKYASEGRRKGEDGDETFIEGVQSISGINDDRIFHNFIYESAMLTATSHSKAKKDNR